MVLQMMCKESYKQPLKNYENIYELKGIFLGYVYFF